MTVEELFRDDYCLVTDHDETRVAIQVGRPPDEATPAIVDAAELRDALDEYLGDGDARQPIQVPDPLFDVTEGMEQIDAGSIQIETGGDPLTGGCEEADDDA